MPQTPVRPTCVPPTFQHMLLSEALREISGRYTTQSCVCEQSLKPCAVPDLLCHGQCWLLPKRLLWYQGIKVCTKPPSCQDPQELKLASAISTRAPLQPQGWHKADSGAALAPPSAAPAISSGTQSQKLPAPPQAAFSAQKRQGRAVRNAPGLSLPKHCTLPGLG